MKGRFVIFQQHSPTGFSPAFPHPVAGSVSQFFYLGRAVRATPFRWLGDWFARRLGPSMTI
jgi:hypothetical protein